MVKVPESVCCHQHASLSLNRVESVSPSIWENITVSF
jgi:hypothetical protein